LLGFACVGVCIRAHTANAVARPPVALSQSATARAQASAAELGSLWRQSAGAGPISESAGNMRVHTQDEGAHITNATKFAVWKSESLRSVGNVSRMLVNSA
jgi:hypothetical protein